MESLVILLIAAFIALLLLGGWGYSLPGVKEPCCAGCSYPTRGLHADRCPECGLSLFGPGTRRPGRRHIVRPSESLAIVCRSILACIALSVFLGIAGKFHTGTSTCEARLQSNSGAFTSVYVISHARYRGPPRTYAGASARAELSGPRGRAVMRVIDARGHARYTAANGSSLRTADAFTDADALEWFRSAGVDIVAPGAAEEAHEVGIFIHNMLAGGMAPESRLPRSIQIESHVESGSVDQVRPVAVALALLAGAGLWAALLLDLDRSRRRDHEFATPATTADSAHSAPRSPS
jgi:hypothetical protein